MKRRHHYTAEVPLSPRETEVLTLLASGRSRDEIVEILPIKAVTVRAYLESAREKLNAANILHASAIAIAKGLIELIEDEPLRIESGKSDSGRSENTEAEANLVLGRSRRRKK